MLLIHFILTFLQSRVTIDFTLENFNKSLKQENMQAMHWRTVFLDF